MRAVLDAAAPLAEALYDLLREAGGEATPEQRAAFRARLEAAARRIPDRALAGEYRRALLDRFFAAATPAAAAAGRRGLRQPRCAQRRPPAPSPAGAAAAS